MSNKVILKKINLGGAFISLLNNNYISLKEIPLLTKGLLKWWENDVIDKNNTTLQNYVDGPDGIIGIATCFECKTEQFIMRDVGSILKIIPGTKTIVTSVLCPSSKCKKSININEDVFTAGFKTNVKISIPKNPTLYVEVRI